METFFDTELEKLRGQTVFRKNLNTKHSKKLANNLSPFLKEILEIWSALNYQGSIETVEFSLTQSWWYNSLTRVVDKPVFYKSWYQTGIFHMNQSLRDNQVLSCHQENLKASIIPRFAPWHSMKWHLPSESSGKIKNHIVYH